MTNTFTDTIREHSLKDKPDEACGLIFRESGVFIARPYPNSHQPPEERSTAFLIAPAAISEALKTRALVGFYHSHTNDIEDFGILDKTIADEYDLVSYLYHVPTDTFKVYHPDHEPPPLIGRPYVPGVFTCVSVVRDYLKTLGVDVPLLEFEMSEAKTGKKEGVAEYFDELGFQIVTGQLKVGDVVLMMIHCHNYPNHCGVLVEDFEMLHHMFNQLSKIEPYGGPWERLTSLRYRHPDLM